MTDTTWDQEYNTRIEPKLHRPIEDHRELDRELAKLDALRAENLRRFKEMVAKGAGGSTRTADDLIADCIFDLQQVLHKVAEGNGALYGDIQRLGTLPTLLVSLRAILGRLMQKPDTRASLAALTADVLDKAAILGSFTEHNPDIAKGLERRAQNEIMGAGKKVRVYLTTARHLNREVLRVDPLRGRQIGIMILGALVGFGIIKEEAYKPAGARRVQSVYSLTPEASETLLGDPKALWAADGGFPMVSVPDDWTPEEVGGYYHPAIKEWSRMIKGSRRPKGARGAYTALNALQKTPWAINREVLDVLEKVLGHPGLSRKLIKSTQVEIPEVPEELLGLDKETASQEDWQRYREAMSARREAHIHNAKSLQASGRVIRVLNEAQELREEPEIYFVWTYDSRGRMYPEARGVSPQGSDLQKALLRFAYGSQVRNDFQKTLFLTNLAQLWGYDKASYEDSVNWVEEHQEMILSFAKDPLTCTDWVEADSPFCFLAAAMEYRRYLEDPQGFKSFLPINLDASCSGSQHCSAILRDETVAGLTNLRDFPVRSDLYLATAEAAKGLLGAPDGTPLDYFRENGLPRGLVKRPTMTVAYGCTRYSLPYSLYEDYLRDAGLPGVDPYKVAFQLTPYVWEAMNQTQASTMRVMEALQGTYKEIPEKRVTLRWETPDGFPAFQRYSKDLREEVTAPWGPSLKLVKTVFHDRKKGDKADTRKHLSSVAPNVIHSLDATHMRMVINRMSSEYCCGDFAMIHDSFGVPVGFSDILWRVVREEFYQLYRDGLQLSLGGVQVKLPEQGSLKLHEVLTSEFSFK